MPLEFLAWNSPPLDSPRITIIIIIIITITDRNDISNNMLHLMTVTNIFYRLPVILFSTKMVYHTARHLPLTESVQIMSFLIKDAMT